MTGERIWFDTCESAKYLGNAVAIGIYAARGICSPPTHSLMIRCLRLSLRNAYSQQALVAKVETITPIVGPNSGANLCKKGGSSRVPIWIGMLGMGVGRVPSRE